VNTAESKPSNHVAPSIPEPTDKHGAESPSIVSKVSDSVIGAGRTGVSFVRDHWIAFALGAASLAVGVIAFKVLRRD